MRLALSDKGCQFIRRNGHRLGEPGDARFGENSFIVRRHATMLKQCRISTITNAVLATKAGENCVVLPGHDVQVKKARRGVTGAGFEIFRCLNQWRKVFLK